MNVHLSRQANREEFGISQTPLGNLICSFPLVWGRVNGKIQACIYIPEIFYPNFERITREEAKQ